MKKLMLLLIISTFVGCTEELYDFSVKKTHLTEYYNETQKKFVSRTYSVEKIEKKTTIEVLKEKYKDEGMDFTSNVYVVDSIGDRIKVLRYKNTYQITKLN